MALREFDVLKTLSDPHLQEMDFFVDNSLHVRGEAYTKIFDLIKHEQILLVEGTNPNRAEYHPDTDTLVMQNVDPPPDLFNRSMLIHECTHAIKDMEHVTISQMGNEAAAYLAQGTYLLLSNRNPPIGPGWEVVELAVRIARELKLDTEPGIQRRIDSFYDLSELVKRIRRNPAYRSEHGLSTADGISGKPTYIDIPASPEPIRDTIHHTEQVERVPLSDSYLISLLQPRYAADDVAGFGARARKLEQVFRSASIEEALPLFTRLVSRRLGDNVSMLFHDHLSTPTRKNLVQILQDRIAGK